MTHYTSSLHVGHLIILRFIIPNDGIRQNQGINAHSPREAENRILINLA